MVSSMIKTAAATAAFGLVHSALASKRAKGAAEGLVGTRARNGLYRPLYAAQSVAATVALVAYVRRLPDRTLYEARGPLAAAMRAGQAAGLAALTWSVLEVGVPAFGGLTNLAAWASGRPDVPPEAEGQGPAPEPDGLAMHAEGPFRATRHPLNLGTLPVLWLQPRMTANLLAFNLVATAYLLLGSKLEEGRLAERNGEAYEDYRRAVPFFPGMRQASGTPSTTHIGEAVGTIRDSRSPAEARSSRN